MAERSRAVTRLQHSYALSPITALAFYDAGPDRVLLLAGEDTWIKVYDTQTTRLLGQLNVFSSQPIHGIHVSSQNDETRLLIWGGHSVTLLAHATVQALLNNQPLPQQQQPTESKTPDWIYDGILFPSTTTVTGALVTAHNEILPFTFTFTDNDNDDNSHNHNNNQPPLTFGPLTSPSRPILYSANLALLSPSVLLVAGGTVFGEIIVWKYYAAATAAAATAEWEVLYVFTGHEGSIFGVSISDEIGIGMGGGEEGRVGMRLLASCSDDRTVRVWDISEGGHRCSERGLDGARETGFGENSEARKGGNGDDAARCVAVAMGHVSRIWHVGFGRVGSGRVEVYSFGEDCSRQRWELELDLERWRGGEPGTLRHCGASTCHSGKNIWSAAVLSRGDSEPLTATGGADGKIVVSGKTRRGEGSGADTYEDLDLSLTFDEVQNSLQGSTPAALPPTKKATKHAFQRYAFLSDTLMAATASGRLFLATMGDRLSWKEVALPETIVADLRPYNVIKSPARDTAVVGSASGKVYLFRKGQEVTELANLPEKISDIILLDTPNHAVDNQPWSGIINVLGLDHAMLLRFDPSTNTSTMDPRKVRLQEHYIVTAAAFCGKTLILGSRTGSVTVYTTDPATGDFVPLINRKDCKAKDAITCILPIPGTTTTNNSFLTTSRDGKYRIYTLRPSSPAAGLELQHEISPPLNTLESAFFTTRPPDCSLPSSYRTNKPLQQQKSELILHGFRGPNFLTYNDSTGAILSSIPCGGAHRPFATVSCPHDPGQMRFVFSKAGDLRVVSQSGEQGERVLRSGGHGREIKSLSSSYSCSSSHTTTTTSSSNTSKEEEEAAKEPLIATAAEDTTIRIWRHNKTQKMECLAIVEGHSAGIQTLRFSGAHYLLSSAGSEELFVWRLSQVDSTAYDALAVVREAVWDDRTADGDLRIVDFDVAAVAAVAAAAAAGDDDDDDNDGGGGGERLVVSMGLSDSSVRSYVYSSRRKGFELLASGGRYTGACPTQVRHLRVDGEEIHVLTAFTDGHVAVWRTQDKEFSLALVVRLHQSSIKSLDLSSSSAGEEPRRWLVATGGDDNALGFLDLAWDESKGGYIARGRYRVKDAHAAAVTGLCVVKGESGMVEVATASNDQRVKLWRVERSAAGRIRVAMLDNRYSSVADAGDLELIAPGKLMVGGVGMEEWDVSRGGIEESR
ncbi:putative cytosolic iron-sulfur protein assembly protein 1 [Chaetomidium leptoderma]|uniref:Cytosolic iron-sulfur protein assembly protein 1 n=1 Tax=Chaetomidium leptoderma TaxID=669021 RepID=A0AAN6VU24_9PEZI|nr:putative cytosolic iron-sulfur protein assembly protein 1 [Chaetomidium leptoderma]